MLLLWCLFVVYLKGAVALVTHKQENTTTLQLRLRRQIVSEDLSWANEMAVYVNILLGSNAQPFRILLDTGSDVLWVPSATTGMPKWISKNKYNPSQSGTFLLHPEPFFIKYMMGEVMGRSAWDRLQIAGVSIEKFLFGVACSASIDPNLPPSIDGVMGVSRGITQPYYEDTLLKAMCKTGAIGSLKFGMKLCPHDSPLLGTGKVVFGGICEECKDGHFIELPVHTPNFWCMHLDGFFVGNSQIYQGALTACMDTGGGFIRGATQFTDAVNRQLTVLHIIGRIYQVRCDHRHLYPMVRFSFGATTINLSPSQYIIMNAERKCISAFVASGEDDYFWKFGLPVHRYSYVVYDDEQSRILIAKAKCP